MTYSRTNRPFPRVAVGEGQALKEITGGQDQAIVGDGFGNVNVLTTDSGTSQYGMVWIRLVRGVDSVTGRKLTSPPCKALAYRDFYPAENMPIKVSIDPVSRLYRIEGNDNRLAAQGGLNVNGLNSQAPANNKKWLKDIRNMKPFIPSTNTSGTTKITIEPYLYIYNGILKNAQKGITDDIDLEPYIPSTGLERLVGVAIKVSDNSVQIVSGSTRTINGAEWTLADYQELYDLLDGDVMPSYIIRLANAQTTGRMSDVHRDWRQFINVPSPTSIDEGLGYPNPIAAAITLSAGRQLIVANPFEIASGASLIVEAGSSVIQLPKDVEQSYAPRIVTSDYTITSADRTILANASSNAVTVTLPDSATVTGRRFDIKAIDLSGGEVTLTSTDNIDGSPDDLTLSLYTSITVEAINGDYYIL